METHKLVMPEHLNHFGFLFGGNLLKWIDEVSYIAVTLDYPGCNFVTVGMDNIKFKKSIRQGTILCFDSKKNRVGTLAGHIWPGCADRQTGALLNVFAVERETF